MQRSCFADFLRLLAIGNPRLNDCTCRHRAVNVFRGTGLPLLNRVRRDASERQIHLKSALPSVPPLPSNTTLQAETAM